MARGKGSGKQETAGQPKFGGEFVNISLQGVAWQDIQNSFPKSQDVARAIGDLLQDGYRVGFALDSRSGGISCSLTCRNEASPNVGLIMTSFASNWFEAAQVSLYKHYVVTSERWRSQNDEGEKPSFG